MPTNALERANAGSRRRMRQTYLLLAAMVILMLVVHFKKITRNNQADAANMVMPQSPPIFTRDIPDDGGIAAVDQ